MLEVYLDDRSLMDHHYKSVILYAPITLCLGSKSVSNKLEGHLELSMHDQWRMTRLEICSGLNIDRHSAPLLSMKISCVSGGASFKLLSNVLESHRLGN